MNCYDCPYLKIVFLNTLEEVPLCKKYNLRVPMSHLGYNFFCWDMKEQDKGEKNGSDRSN